MLNPSKVDKTSSLIVIFAVLYNGVLAFINANAFSTSMNMSIAVEVCIIFVCLATILRTGFLNRDRYPLILLLFVILNVMFVFVSNGFFALESLRNVLVIFAFITLGFRAKVKELHFVFFIVNIFVFVFCVIEIASLDTFVKIFQPALYYFHTRGKEIAEFNEVGVFGAALSYEGRFGFSLFSGPRTSSIFLEQVSIGNYAALISMYLAIFWDRLDKVKFFYLSTLLLIILSSNTRFGLGMAVMSLFVYLFNPKIRKSTVLLGFLALLFFGFIYQFYFNFRVTDFDTFLGRINYGFYNLFSLSISDLFGFGYANIIRFGDSGLPFSTITLGFVAALFFVFMLITDMNSDGVYLRQSSFLVFVYIIFNLVISGTSIYSMKTASLCWFMYAILLKEDWYYRKNN